jgi:hypothetical protein
MRRFITVWSLCCAILFAWSISGQAAIIFDNSSRGDAQSNREAENSSIAAITVSAPTSIGQIGAMLDPSGNGNLRYVIFNLGTSALLFQTGPQAFVDTGLGFYLSAYPRRLQVLHSFPGSPTASGPSLMLLVCGKSTIPAPGTHSLRITSPLATI